jgi:hypothetical protein
VKEIEGTNGLYMASEDGRIYSVRAGRYLTPSTTPSGYFGVNIRRTRITHKKVHRLIAETFLPAQEGKPDVNHKNGIKTDNRVDNLEWVTRSENIQHSINVTRTFPLGEKRSWAILNNKDVLEIKSLLKKGERVSKIAKQFNVSVSTIRKIINGLMWKHVALTIK